MFASKQIIYALFRIINFVIIAWLVRYLFKKFGLPEIKEKRSEKLSFFKNLQKKYKDLVGQNSLATKEIKDQDELFEMLNTKIQTWNNERQNQENIIKNELEKVKSSHKERIEKQTENMHQKKIIREVFPRAIEETYKQLEKKFSKEQEAKTFLKSIISHMEKSAK